MMLPPLHLKSWFISKSDVKPGMIWQIIIGAEDKFDGIVDLVSMKAYHFDGKPEEDYVEIPIPAEMMDEVNARREELISAVADFDDDLMMLYL